jgi:hypothetical protein
MPTSRLRIAIWSSLIIVACAAVMGIVVIVRAGIELNEHIDLCSDQTSGKYIWDKAEREKACRSEQTQENSN